jgi:uncharacterized MnhB-related membrane protein
MMMKPRHIVTWGVATLVLLLVFAAYLRPDVAMTLANQLWSCF